MEGCMELANVKSVVVRGGAAGFAQEIHAGRHKILADEPESAGGTDTGATPYDLLLAALGSCTSMTVGMYARRKSWPLEEVIVYLRHAKSHATDCANCESPAKMLDLIELDIHLEGPLTEDQRSKLLEISKKCPVHRVLESSLNIQTRQV
jgi:putative redox protein